MAQTPVHQNAIEIKLSEARNPKADTDEDFIRRVSSDLRGVEPTPAEVHFFVTNKDARKRDKLIDLFVKEREELQAKAAKKVQHRVGEAAIELVYDEVAALKKALADAEAVLVVKQKALVEMEALKERSDKRGKEATQQIDRAKVELAAAQSLAKKLAADLADAQAKGDDREALDRRIRATKLLIEAAKKGDRVKVDLEAQLASLTLKDKAGIATITASQGTFTLDCAKNDAAQQLVTDLAKKHVMPKNTAVNLPRVAVKGWLEFRPSMAQGIGTGDLPGTWVVVVESLSVVGEKSK